MSEGNEGGQGGNEGQGGGQSGQAESGGGTAPREWMAALPEDLRGDATLARYETPEAQVRGHLEARRALAGRVAVPGADADAATRDAFFTAIGRPANAEGYEIAVPEGQDATRANAFAAKALELGVPKDMAQAIVKWNDEAAAADLKAWQDAAEKEVTDWKAKTPDAEAKVTAIQGLFERFGGDAATAAEIEARLGTGKMLDLFANMAAAMGEHARHDGKSPNPAGTVDAASVEQQWTAKMADSGWRAKVAAGDADAVREYETLVAARRDAEAARQAAGKRSG